MMPDYSFSAGWSELVHNDEQLEQDTVTSTDVDWFQVGIGAQPTNRAKTKWPLILTNMNEH